MAVRPRFVNVSSSRGISAVGIQVLSSNPNPSAVLHGMAQVSQQESTRSPTQEERSRQLETLPLERQSQDVPHTVEPEDTQDDGNYKYKVKIFNRVNLSFAKLAVYISYTN